MNRTRLIFISILVVAGVIVIVSLLLRGTASDSASASLTVDHPDAVNVRILTALPIEPWVRSAAEEFNAGDYTVDGVPIEVEIVAS